MKKRGQPKKEVRRESLKLTIRPEIKALASTIAFKNNTSISREFENWILSLANQPDQLGSNK